MQFSVPLWYSKHNGSVVSRSKHYYRYWSRRKIAKTLRSFASQKDAPDFILLLNNELADLHLVVLAIRNIYQKQQVHDRLYRAHNAPVDNSIASALTQAQQTASELQALYDRMITASGQGEVAKFKTKSWLLESRKVKKVLEDLRNARLKLAAVLGILNSYVIISIDLPTFYT